MKLIKYSSDQCFISSEPFDFKTFTELDGYNLSTTYIKGESSEFQNENDLDRIFLVIEGSVKCKIQDNETIISKGDLVLIPRGERFQLNAVNGARILRMAEPQQQNHIDEISGEGDKNSKNDGVDHTQDGKIKELTYNRHSTREFSDKPISKKDVYYVLKIGVHAPSGANRQPWKFIVVGDPEIKRKIREEAEKVERVYYRNLKNDDLRRELQNLGLTWRKPFLETAPFLICIFGDHKEPYYKESLWLATGWMLLAAAELGLATLTYKPDDMLFLSKLLDVSGDFTPELIIPIGHAAKSDPIQPRKDLGEVVEWI